MRTEKLLAKLIESTVLSESYPFMHAVGGFMQYGLMTTVSLQSVVVVSLLIFKRCSNYSFV